MVQDHRGEHPSLWAAQKLVVADDRFRRSVFRMLVAPMPPPSPPKHVKVLKKSFAFSARASSGGMGR